MTKTPETEIVEDGNAPKYTAIMAMHQAIHAKPVEFTNTVNNMLVDKAAVAVEKRREEIAQRIFGNQNQEPEAVDNDAQPEPEAETNGEPEPEGEVKTDKVPSED